jgi:hypothetical protein
MALPLDKKALLDSYQIEMPTQDVVQMDVGYVDNVIQGQGVSFLHYRAIPCPVGLGDPGDIRHTHSDHTNCSNGFIYELAGEVVCFFSGNGKSFQWQDIGMVSDASVQVTVPRYYIDRPGEEALLSPFDRLYLKEASALVVTFQKFEHNQSGMDRLHYPIVEVESIIDSNGVKYTSSDFVLESGQIKWTGYNRPAMDPKTNRGQVCAVRYRYVPFWYVSRILHEIRMVQAREPGETAASTKRMPYAVVLQREYLFENEKNDPRAVNPDSSRMVAAPRRGSFGPR